MPGFPPNPPSLERHADVISTTKGSDVVAGKEVRDMELSQDQSKCLNLSTLSPLELNEKETRQEDGSWSRDGDVQRCEQ